MDVKKVIAGMVAFGIPISVISKGVEKDHSTIGKWLKGTTGISQKLEKQLEVFIEQKRQEWENIFN